MILIRNLLSVQKPLNHSILERLGARGNDDGALELTLVRQEQGYECDNTLVALEG